MDELYQPFIALFNEIYEAKCPQAPQLPSFSLLRVLISHWSNSVFAPLEAQLLATASALLQTLRREKLPKTLDDARLLTLMRYTQSLADLSVTPSSVHFLSHSLLPLPSPYLSLHSSVLEICKASLPHPSQVIETVTTTLEADLALLRRVFLPVTARQVQLTYAEYELSLWKDHFQRKFQSDWRFVAAKLREEVADLHLNSAFGLFLFELEGSKLKVRGFLEYLLSEDSSNLVRMNRFNDLTQVLEEAGTATLEDEELEYCLGREGKTLGEVQLHEEQPSQELLADCYRLS